MNNSGSCPLKFPTFQTNIRKAPCFCLLYLRNGWQKRRSSSSVGTKKKGPSYFVIWDGVFTLVSVDELRKELKQHWNIQTVLGLPQQHDCWPWSLLPGREQDLNHISFHWPQFLHQSKSKCLQPLASQKNPAQSLNTSVSCTGQRHQRPWQTQRGKEPISSHHFNNLPSCFLSEMRYQVQCISQFVSWSALQIWSTTWILRSCSWKSDQSFLETASVCGFDFCEMIGVMLVRKYMVGPVRLAGSWETAETVLFMYMYLICQLYRQRIYSIQT